MGFLLDNNIKAVAFDIDGTFYPLKETNRRVLRASIFHLPFALSYNKARQMLRTKDSFLELEPLTREKNAERMCRIMYGKADERTVSKFLGKEKKVFTDTYSRLFRNIKPYDGVREVLSLLKEKGYPMAVLSDFPVGTKLSAMGLESFFPVQLSSEDMGRSKPCQTPFIVLGEKLGVERGSILYVGDSERKDILGAKYAGLKSVLISSEGKKSEADLTVSDWKELKEKLFGE